MVIIKTNATQILARCSELLAGDWLEAPELHDKADAELSQLIADLYTDHDPDKILAALSSMQSSYRRTVITDRLAMLECEENLSAYEADTIELDHSEYQSMVDAGQIQELTPDEAQKLIERSKGK